MQTSTPRQKTPVKQLVIGLLIAVVLGFFQPILVPYVVASPVLTFLFAYAGFAPFLVCALLQLVLYNVLGGLPLTIMALLASALPAAFAVRGVRWKKPFGEQLRVSLVAQIAGLLAALGYAFSQYGSLVSKIMEVLRSQLSAYPNELLDVFMQGRFESAEELLAAVETNLTLQLPGLILTMGVFSAVFMVALPNWLLHRRGQDAPGCYAALARWRVPGNVVAGVLGLVAVSLVLYFSGMRGGDSVFMTARSVCDACFLLQAMGSLARFARRTNLARGWRNVLLVLSLTLLQTVAVYFGCFSALFGSHGLATGLVQKYREKHKDE